MASKLADINDLYICTGNTQPSGAVITNVSGAAVDMATCANNNNFCIFNIGTVAGTEIVFTAKIQESPTTTGASFTDISGGTFPGLTSTTGTPGIQLLNFQRTQRFVRFVSTITGTTSAVSMDVLFVGQKNQVS